MVKYTGTCFDHINISILVTWCLWTTNTSQTCYFGSLNPAPCDRDLAYAYDDN
jgi:hypothetical protein